MTDNIIRPIARISVQSGGSGSGGNTPFTVFETSPSNPHITGSCSIAAAENGIVGTLEVEFASITDAQATSIKSNGTVFVDAGYDGGGPSIGRIWVGYVEDMMPTRTGAEKRWKLRARMEPWDLTRTTINLDYGIEFGSDGLPTGGSGVSAFTLLQRIFSAARMTVRENDASAFLRSVIFENFTSNNRTLNDMVADILARVSEETGRTFGPMPELSGQLSIYFAEVTKNAQGVTQGKFIGARVANINLDAINFNSAGVRSSRIDPVKHLIYDSNTGALTNPTTGSGIALTDGKIRSYEYDIATPLDPRIVPGLWVNITGLAFGTIPEPATFNILSVKHTFGGDSWTTSYSGPMLIGSNEQYRT